MAAGFWVVVMDILPVEESQKKTQMQQKWTASVRLALTVAAPAVAGDLRLRLAEYWRWGDSEPAV